MLLSKKLVKKSKVHFEEAEEECETSKTESKGSTGRSSNCYKEHGKNLWQEKVTQF